MRRELTKGAPIQLQWGDVTWTMDPNDTGRTGWLYRRSNRSLALSENRAGIIRASYRRWDAAGPMTGRITLVLTADGASVPNALAELQLTYKDLGTL